MKNLNTRGNVEEFLDSLDTVLLDCDGVLWKGGDLLPHTVQVLNMLRDRGKRIFFLTNNSTSSRRQYLEKFKQRGIDVELHEIHSSATVAADYLAHWCKEGEKEEEGGKQRKIYLVGSDGLKEELDAAGVPNFGVKEHRGNTLEEDHFSTLDAVDRDVSAVLIGYDRYFNSFKLAYATYCCRFLDGCQFFATNMDPSLPFKNGLMLPGTGSYANALSTAVGRIPDKVFGKPGVEMLDQIVGEYQLDKSRMVMIGDRLETDILMGKNAGIRTLAVLTGVVTREDMQAEGAIKPDYVIQRLGNLYDCE